MNKILQPEAIFIQLLTYCNAECINCPFEFTYNSVHPAGKMSDKTWHKILSDIIKMEYQGQIGFYLHHEPLIDKTLFSKIKDINEKTKAHVVLSTNGQLLTESNIDKLIEAKPRRVHLNINSGNKREYETSMKGLKYETTIQNCKNFIEKGKHLIDIEVNCPVISGYDVNSLKEIFPEVNINLDFWANSRGGLLPDFYHENKGSRFKIENYCKQPTQNFNILYDGSVIACCMDWMHESKMDFPNINDSSILEVYNKITKLEKSFRRGDYKKYKMCNNCSKEMGFNRYENPKFEILITNHHFTGFTGSENLIISLAEQLKANGHNVTIYSKFIGDIHVQNLSDDFRLVNNLEELKDEYFDIAHVHHNISVYEVRNFFPDLPLVFYSQGILPFLEQPPIINSGISKFGAISEEVKANLINNGVEESKIEIIRNFIDAEKFKCDVQVNSKPSTAIVISRNIDDEKVNKIKEACLATNINVEFFGGRFGEITPAELKIKISESDIIFSLGRGAIEAMMMGKAVIVYDYLGGDGIVTPENYTEVRKHNFSGRRYKLDFTIEELVEEIKKYNVDSIEKMKKLILKEHSAQNVVKKFVETYERIVDSQIENYDKKIVNHFYNIVKQTNEASASYVYTKLQTSESENITAGLINIAEEFIGNEKISEARKILEFCLLKSPNNIDVMNDLAVVEIIDQNFSAALQWIVKVLEKNPMDEVALGNLEYLESTPQEEVSN